MFKLGVHRVFKLKQSAWQLLCPVAGILALFPGRRAELSPAALPSRLPVHRPSHHGALKPRTLTSSPGTDSCTWQDRAPRRAQLRCGHGVNVPSRRWALEMMGVRSSLPDDYRAHLGALGHFYQMRRVS